MRLQTPSLVLLLALASPGCAATPTQVIVHVDAEPGVRDMTRSIGIRIWGRARDGTFAEEPDVIEPVAGSRYVWRVSTHPLSNDHTRFFRLEAGAYSTANGQGTQIAVARLQSGYLEGQTLHLYLLLQDECIGISCADVSTTCAGAACIPIPDPVEFDPDAGLPRDAGVPEMSDGGMDAAIADAGVDAGLLDAGGDAARDARVFGDGCVPAPEVCNLGDDDCDEAIDEDFDTTTSLAHCGACDTPCTQPRATPECVGGSCQIARCNDGFGDCDELIPGCETPVTTILNCGSCGRACMGGLLCALEPGGYNCVSSCTGGRVDCGGSCVDTSTDVLHCGACDDPCPVRENARETCTGGVCGFECLPGFADCDGRPDNGCEINVRNDLANCGACERPCPSRECQAASCSAGACSYRPDDARPCDDGLPCTMNACSGGACTTVADTCGMDGGMVECTLDSDCPDMGACSDDRCVSNTCQHSPIGYPCCESRFECGDGNACTTDSCSANVCQNTAMPGCTSCFGPEECDDFEPCTNDTCSSGVCVNSSIPGCTACGMVGCGSGTPTCCSDVADYCCPSGGACCGGSCCGAGEDCCGGSCCPSGTCCGGACCGPGFVCSMGVCSAPASDAGVDAGSDAGVTPTFDAGTGFDAGFDAGFTFPDSGTFDAGDV